MWVVFWNYGISFKRLSDPFSDAHRNVFWKPSRQLRLRGMKLCMLLLAGKHACLKPTRLFVLLWTTALTESKRQLYPQEKGTSKSFLPSTEQQDPTGFLIHPSGQSSRVASALLTSARQWRGAEFAAQQGLTKTLSTEEFRHYPKRKTTPDCSGNTAPADQQSPNSFEILCQTQSLPAGYDPVPFDWRHVGTNHGDALLLRPCECFWLYAPF